MDGERREFIQQLTLLLSGLAAGRALAACRPERGSESVDSSPALPTGSETKHGVETAHAFHPNQRRTFEAATSRILPSDHDPGAREANVIEYIDRELARPEFEKVKKAMLAGVVALDRVAQRFGGKQFIELSQPEQDEVIRQIQQASDRGREFVQFLVLLTIEGFVSDPMYGGNAHGVGWRMIGYGPGNPDGSGEGAHGGH